MVIKSRPVVHRKEMMSQVGYYECILSNEIPGLEKSGDLQAFLKIIGFVDEKNIVLTLYQKFCNAIREVQDSELNKFNIYYEIIVKEQTENKKVMRDSLRKWLNEYHKDYKDYLKFPPSYVEFLNFLFKYTDVY